MGRYLTKNDMASAKHEEEVCNSRLKRNEVADADKIVSQRHIVCGCRVEGCIFMHYARKTDYDV